MPEAELATAPAATETPPSRPKRRWRRRLLVLLVLGVGAGLLATHLHWLRAPLVAFVQRRTGLTIDFSTASVGLSRVHVTGLRLLSAPAYRDRAPDVLRIDEVDARFSLSGLRRGELSAVTIHGVHGALILEERGSSWPALPSSASAPTPLGLLLSHLVPLPVQIATLTVDGIDGRLVLGEASAPVELTLAGLGLRGQIDRAAARAALAEAPLTLTLTTGDTRRVLVVRPAMSASLAAGGEGALVIGLGYVRSEGLFKQAPPTAIAEIQIKLQVDPGKQSTRLVTTGARLLGGGVILDADLRLTDGVPIQPRLASFAMAIDLAPLVAAIPEGIFDRREGSGKLRLSGSELALGPRGLPLPGAQLAVEGTIADVRLARPNFGLALAKLSARGELKLDDDGRPYLSLEMPFEALQFSHEAGAHDFRRGRARVAVQPRSLKALWPVAVTAFVDLEDSDSHILGNHRLVAEQLHLELVGQADRRNGKAELRLRAGHVRYRVPGTVDVEHRDVKLRLASDSLYMGRAFLRKLADAELDVDIGAGTIEGRADGRPIRFGPAPFHVVSTARDVVLRPEDWFGSFGRLTVEGELADVALHLQADRTTAAALDYELAIDAKRLFAIAQLLAGRFPQIDLDRPAVHVESKGRISRPGRWAAMTLTQKGALRVAPFAAASWSGRQLDVALTSAGNGKRQTFELGVATKGLSRGGAALADQQIALRGLVDLARPRLAVTMNGRGEALPLGQLTVELDVDEQAKVVGKIDGELAQLAVVGELARSFELPALRAVAWEQLTLSPHATFALSGLLQRRGGHVELAPAPWETLRGDAELTMAAAGLKLDRGGLRVAATGVELQIAAHADRAAARATVRLAGRGLRLTTDAESVEVSTLRLTLEGRRDGALVDLALTGGVDRAQQSFWPGYPIGGLEVAVRLAGDPRRTLRLSEGRIDNPAGETHLDVTGAIEQGGGADAARASADAIAGRRALHLVGTFAQGLAKLPAPFDAAAAGGKLELPFELASNDRQLFTLLVRPKLHQVAFRLLSPSIEVSGLDAELVIRQAIVRSDEGLQRLAGGERAAPLRVRFGDSLPLLTEPSWFRIGALRLGDSRVGPLAGNFAIDHSLVALDQVEVSAFGGTLRGQLLLDLAGAATQALVRVDASSLLASDGSRFDGTMNLALNAAEERLDGRVEISRLGKRHLYDLMTALDPTQTDPTLMRLRSLFRIAHPRRLTLRLAEGLGNLSLELGGLGQLVRIEEVRGMPLGPLWRRWLAPVVATLARTSGQDRGQDP